jgi:hypothetical protein
VALPSQKGPFFERFDVEADIGLKLTNFRFVPQSRPLCKAQRRSGFRPSCRNVHGAASVTIGPERTLVLCAAKVGYLNQVGCKYHEKRVESDHAALRMLMGCRQSFRSLDQIKSHCRGWSR